MSRIYGKDFAAIYDETWFNFSRMVWPFVSDTVSRRVPDAGTWLDLCCGSGHLLELLRRSGISATGLDASSHQLRLARRRAPGTPLIRGDVRSFDLGRRFDVITCLYDSLNYLTSKRDLAGALRNARRHLKQGGVFIFDVNTDVYLRSQWRHVFVRHERRFDLIVETSFDDVAGLGCAVMTGFVREGGAYRKFRERHFQRGYNKEELEGLLRRIAFSFKPYDGRTMSRPRPSSDRLLYVCSR